MAGGYHSDARREIQKQIPIHVFDAHAFAPLGNQGVVPRIRRGDELAVECQDLLSFRTRERRFD
jgi:hypothetical protein